MAEERFCPNHMEKVLRPGKQICSVCEQNEKREYKRLSATARAKIEAMLKECSLADLEKIESLLKQITLPRYVSLPV